MRERERENERKIVKERERRNVAWKNIQDQVKMISAL